jgi:hypothetical protein
VKFDKARGPDNWEFSDLGRLATPNAGTVLTGTMQGPDLLHMKSATCLQFISIMTDDDQEQLNVDTQQDLVIVCFAPSITLKVRSQSVQQMED